MSKSEHLENIQFEMDNISTQIYNIVAKNSLTYNIITYGCAMNEHDSEQISGILEKMGFVHKNDADADLILFNTCCVRDNAENKLFGNVGALKQQKISNKNKIIGVCGCMMQQKDYANELKNKFPFLDIIFGTHNIQNLPRMILDALNHKKTIEVFDTDGYIVEGLPVKRVNDFSAFINIIYGCNNFCTYCIVPYVRGRERSRHSSNIIEEAKTLVSEGIIEITLLGQNVNSYNNGNDDLTFPDLLQELAKIEGLKRIKFMTSHPKDFSDELIDVIKNNENISRHIHLPVQAGDSTTLKNMNRGYSREDYLNLIDKIKNNIPDAGISTDIIVGFPGETQEQFLNTLDLMDKVKFDTAFSFMYNVRKGTKAENMDNQIEQSIKADRLDMLLKKQLEISNNISKSLVGNMYEVLVEKMAKQTGQVCGRSMCGKLINLDGDESMIGNIVNVKITKYHKNSLSGVII